MTAKKVCILHVGGTIGMTRTDTGLQPEPGLIERYLLAMSELSRSDVPDWDVVPLEPLLDSADMRPMDWVRVADAVIERYDEYAGFVVLHGTDTMVYTASALSFLLRGLAKPIIFTGAQLTLLSPRSDGRNHIITALILVATERIPEVCIYFGGLLLRGNRAQKVNNNDFVAYASGNYPPLATVGVRIQVSHYLLLPEGDGEVGAVPLVREPRVASFRVFPGMSAEMLENLLQPPLEGLVLETYGSGTFPSGDVALLDVIRRAVQRGLVVVSCSQCHSGSVRQGLYGTGQALADVGVNSGHDMTPEAALTKLYCLLGGGNDVSLVRERMSENLAGELRSAHLRRD